MGNVTIQILPPPPEMSAAAAQAYLDLQVDTARELAAIDASARILKDCGQREPQSDWFKLVGEPEVDAQSGNKIHRGWRSFLIAAPDLAWLASKIKIALLMENEMPPPQFPPYEP